MKIFTSLASILIASVLFLGCESSVKEEAPAHSPFHAKISAFTSGQVSSTSPVMVEFSSPVAKAEAGSVVQEGIVKISPSVEGSAVWAGNRTLIFKPEEVLPSGKEFKVEVNLPRLLPGENESFFFTFRTVQQNAWLSLENIQPVSVTEYDSYTVTARVALADVADDEVVEKNVTVTYEGAELHPEWTHIDGRIHELSVSGLSRGRSENDLLIQVAEGPLSPDDDRELEVAIPALDDFKIVSARMESSPRNVITVTFSDPVDPTQDVSGLFVMQGVDLDWNIQNNRVELYSGESVTGNQTLKVLPDIRNAAGAKLNRQGEFTFSFSTEAPQVELLGEGTIMPFSEGLYLPFRGVSLKSVKVRIIKIYEHNIGHFLQINRLGGESQLKRAGRLVHRQSIAIDNDPTLDLNRWNTFSLDLSKFVQPDPGAIYRVELGFEKEDAIYACAGDDESESVITKDPDPDDDFWDEPNDYYSTYPYNYSANYNWYDRDDPCTDSYYTRQRWVATNVLASNLGLMAKRGNNEEMLVTVTDLRNAQPLKGVEVEVFNLQMVSLDEGISDKDGFVPLTFKETPFLLVAKQGKQRGYLKLNEGEALSLDRFDVSGETVKEGLRGFIFGERGVWRPGDSIFVSFMPVESSPGTLPSNHPVTFELTDPRGRLIDRQVSTHPENLLYTFRTSTREDAPTGMWLARISMGGVLFEKTLRVETIRPNRLKIHLNFPEEELQSGKSTDFDVHSEWLHGSPASDLRADVRMTVKERKTTFPDYAGYNFDDVTRSLDASEVTIFEGILNDEGNASFRERLPSFDRAPGKLTAQLTSRVFEEGGAFSIASQRVSLSPFEVYTGIRTPPGDDRGLLLTDEDHTIEVVSVDADGKPVGGQNLTYSVYKIEWRWWWEKSDEDLGRYVSFHSNNRIDKGMVTTSGNGKATFDIRINKPEWGRYLIRVANAASGHSAAATVRVDWPGWARESRGGESASELIFSTDKKRYKVGEDVVVSFPSGDEGRALVSVETGTRILKSWWISPESKETQFSFKATSEMSPNIYVSVTLIQPHAQTGNNRPIRLYGIVPVMIEDPGTRLEPQLKTKDTWLPGNEAEIEVSEKNNEAFEYVVAVVDEGLLDLTGFRTPDPWQRFNARQALGIKTWDLYDEVIGAFGGKIEQLFSVGGDGELSGDRSQNQMRRFEPMVRFFGPFHLKRGSEKHKFTVPEYTGSVRVMVIGTNGIATGSEETTVKVKKPVMVWSSLPRVMGPQEKLWLPVTIFVTDENVRDVTVSLKGSEHYKISGKATQNLTFASPGEQTVYFELKTGSVTGMSQLVIAAQSSGGKDEITKNLMIRVPNPPVTRTVFTSLKGKASESLQYELPGMSGTNSMQLEVSAIPPMDLTARLSYLLEYPHGCIEQITSGAFPQLYLSKIVEMTEEQKSRARENIGSVLARYSSYQTSEGGFAYWPGQSYSNEWGSSYAGHFLLEAEKQGYMVKPNVKSAWLKWQKQRANAWLPKSAGDYYASEQMLQAYRLFTLALAGEPVVGAMNRLRQKDNLVLQARWLLASAYSISGMQEVAGELMDGSIDSGAPELVHRTYGSQLRDEAILIHTLTLLDRRETAFPLVKEAAERLSSESWYSTQTTAWALMSIVNFAGQHMEGDPLQYTYNINQGNEMTVGSEKPVSLRNIEVDETLKGVVQITNDTDNELFVTLVVTGTPEGIDSTSFSENLRMETSFRTMDGNRIKPGNIEQGTDFLYVVRVSNPGTGGDIENLALTRLIPSGWEIRNTRLEGNAVHEKDIPDYRDIRDDRVMSYFDLNAGKTKVYVVVVHAAFPGEYYLPPVSCEAMYNRNVRARVGGSVVKVIKP
ncbi:alpha-2-macroglobulin [Marinilabilia salmonicolor]|uniref:alpha-2-macroglobulin n=1 Tax=Marinilabilia salmonicolor TaxID=989 RepID=UPI00029B0B83|nr:MG2 domain-containing protein [Marinilabilia salmonicolor]